MRSFTEQTSDVILYYHYLANDDVYSNRIQQGGYKTKYFRYENYGPGRAKKA